MIWWDVVLIVVTASFVWFYSTFLTLNWKENVLNNFSHCPLSCEMKKRQLRWLQLLKEFKIGKRFLIHLKVFSSSNLSHLSFSRSRKSYPTYPHSNWPGISESCYVENHSKMPALIMWLKKSAPIHNPFTTFLLPDSNQVSCSCGMPQIEL